MINDRELDHSYIDRWTGREKKERNAPTKLAAPTKLGTSKYFALLSGGMHKIGDLYPAKNGPAPFLLDFNRYHVNNIIHNKNYKQKGAGPLFAGSTH